MWDSKAQSADKHMGRKSPLLLDRATDGLNVVFPDHQLRTLQVGKSCLISLVAGDRPIGTLKVERPHTT